MAELTPPVFLQAGGESAQTSRLAIGSAILTSGTVNPADLTVTAPGGAMSVSVAAGQGWVVGSRASQGAYHVVNDAPKTLTIAASDPTNPRYDRIVANINDAAYLGGVNSFVISIVQGTASSSPVEPAIPADSFELARVTVGAAVATISNGNILDRRIRAANRGGVFQAVATTDVALTSKGAASGTGNLHEFFAGATRVCYVDVNGTYITTGFNSIGYRLNRSLQPAALFNSVSTFFVIVPTTYLQPNAMISASRSDAANQQTALTVAGWDTSTGNVYLTGAGLASTQSIQVVIALPTGTIQ